MSRSLEPAQAENLRQHLRELMKRRGWDQKEMAQRLGLTQQAISSLLVGRTNGSFPMALAAARGLGVSVEELLSGNPVTSDPFPNRTAVLSCLQGEIDEALVRRMSAVDVKEDRPRLWWFQRLLFERESLAAEAGAATMTARGRFS